MSELELNEKKNEFRNGSFFYNAWRDSVQHGKAGTSVYSEKVKNDKTQDKNKKTLKERSRDKLRKLIEVEYLEEIYLNHSVTDEEHCNNIIKLHKEIQEMKDSKNEFNLFSEYFNIGRVQKLLNMLLKYYWTSGVMSDTPPHMPIDSKILEKLDNATDEQKEKLKINWTEISTIDEYKQIIQVAKEIVKAKGYESLTAYELFNWSSK